MLASERLDVVLADERTADPLAALSILKASGLKLPFLILRGELNHDGPMLEYLLENRVPLPRSETMLAAIQENSSDGLFLLNRAGQITFASQGAEKLCGLKIQHLEHSPIAQLWAPSSQEDFSQALNSVLQDGHSIKNMEGFLRFRTGRNIPVILSASPIKEQNRVTCALVTVRNNSELRRASADITLLHKQMDVERSHFETIMRQFPNGIIIAEAPSGRIVFFNEQAQKLLGSEAVGASCIEEYGLIPAITPEGERIQPAEWPLAQALESGAIVSGGVFRIHHKETDSDRYLSLNAAPILNSEGQVTSAVMAIFDITTERQAQQIMVQAKEEAERANHAKTAFLANISHEIRTPLGAILGFTSLLRNDDIPPEERDETLAIVERNGQHLLRLIDEILDLTKVEAQRMDIYKAECSVSAIVRDVMNLLGHSAREKGLNLCVKTAPDTPDTITTDPARLKQILVNIIGNAVKFTEKGSVDIDIGIDGALTPESALLHFRVKDSGIGISPSQTDKLFQPFSQIDCTNTRRFGGTGLGLLLSRKLAKLLGGDVVLEESTPGIGSSFLITINGAPARTPMATPDGEPRPYQALAAPSFARDRLRELVILAADDSLDNQTLLKSFLSRYGAQVDIASNGYEAVDKASKGTYDMVLMDLQMPLCDGYNATRRLRSLGYKKPILALSAHARHEEQEKSLMAGCNDHITKPINLNGLLAAIVRHAGLDAKNL
jgi:PAS domain S-box-containing protein